MLKFLKGKNVAKFVLAYLFLLVLIPITVFSVVNIQSLGETRGQATQTPVKVYLWPVLSNLKVNQSLPVEIRIETEQALTSADVVLSFNPKVVEVLSLAPGSTFSTYAGKLIDNKQGLVGLGGRGEWQKSGVFAQFTIMTKGLGNPDFKFNYLNLGGVAIDAQTPQYQVQ